MQNKNLNSDISINSVNKQISESIEKIDNLATDLSNNTNILNFKFQNLEKEMVNINNEIERLNIDIGFMITKLQIKTVDVSTSVMSPIINLTKNQQPPAMSSESTQTVVEMVDKETQFPEVYKIVEWIIKSLER